MVRTSEPSAWTAKMVHDLALRPSTSTVQAPHCDVSQPTCAPVRCSCSRRKCTSSVRGSTVPLRTLPLTVIEIGTIRPLGCGGRLQAALQGDDNIGRGRASQSVPTGDAEGTEVTESHGATKARRSALQSHRGAYGTDIRPHHPKPECARRAGDNPRPAYLR